MLRHLSIRAFALIEEVELDFQSGMTILIGETGAGKSIIIDALACALGARMSSDVIRKGAKKCVVEATFDATAYPEVQAILEENDLAWDSADLIMRRELSESGTSRCFVNDTPTTTQVARDLAAYLMDFHGQHDTHGLLNTSRHLSILDASSQSSLRPLTTEMENLWVDLRTAERALDELKAKADSADEERARLEFTVKEIGDVDPQPGEDEAIAIDLRRAEASEHVITAAAAARAALYVDESSAYEQLRVSRDHIRDLLPFDPSLEATLADVEAAMTASKEGAAALARYTDGEEDFSPERLEDLRQRQAAIQRLIRKYGSLDSCLTHRAESMRQLSLLENLEEELSRLEGSAKAARDAAEATARKLTKLRKAAAKPLVSSMTSIIAELGMPAAVVDISITTGTLGPRGSDDVEFLFTANAGEEPKPLSRVASGGELSRFMLALKKTLADRGAVGTMVFDEIDTGISGRAARQVGGLMKQIAASQQVICITHLPQIASLADHMIGVQKSEEGGRATVWAEDVVPEHHVTEVARLLSGATITDAALDSARELIADGSNGSR